VQLSLTPQEVYNALPLVRDSRLANSSTYPHSVVVPLASYSPWLGDDEFMRVFESITSHSLVDRYRCFELWSLMGQSARLGGDILEVGVWRGGTGCLLATRAAMMQPGATTFLCDTFKGVAKAGPADPRYRGGEHADTSAATVRELATRLGLSNVEILEGVFPDETAQALVDRQFSFCHVDVDVYESARGVIDWVWPRLKTGGVVVYDDYGFLGCEGVTTLVNQRAGLGGLTVHNLNGHAVVIKLA
jgi:O-methyltransferase